MVEELLVGEQLTPDMIKSGGMLVSALDKLDLLVKGAVWLLLPDQRVWRLMISTPEVGTLGPKAVYRKVRAALARLPSDAMPIGMKDISVVDERDSLFLLLRSTLAKGQSMSNIRFSRNAIDGHLIEDAYLYRVT